MTDLRALLGDKYDTMHALARDAYWRGGHTETASLRMAVDAALAAVLPDLLDDQYGWTYETTAPEPEPWPDEVVDCMEDALLQRDVKDARPSDARALLDALVAKFPGVRAAITGGGQS